MRVFRAHLVYATPTINLFRNNHIRRAIKINNNNTGKHDNNNNNYYYYGILYQRLCKNENGDCSRRIYDASL